MSHPLYDLVGEMWLAQLLDVCSLGIPWCPSVYCREVRGFISTLIVMRMRVDALSMDYWGDIEGINGGRRHLIAGVVVERSNGTII